jgi:5-methylcytosine-specific restriction endonuclease McrA
MPKVRLPRELWRNLRRQVLERDGFACMHCHEPVTEKTCHIDHIRSGKHGSNQLWNLRTLCRRCHVLRLDSRHRGMVAQALTDGIIPVNWRQLLWE